MIDEKAYKNTFISSKDGREILEELTGLFFDRLSFDPQNQYQTAFNEGQRSVIEYILRRTATINQTEDNILYE
jgi:hypothetical protein